MASNPLSPGSLAGIMAASLPKADGSAVKDPYDALALFCHTCMMAVGFRLKGLGEDHRIEENQDAQDSPALPAEWNASAPSYAFRYAHSQSSMEFLVKISRLGSKAVIFAIGLGDEKTASFDVPVKDYVSSDTLPVSADASPDSLQSVFPSIPDLATLFKTNIIQKLVPGLNKPGYEEAVSTSTSSRQTESGRPNPHSPQPHIPGPANPYPFHDPLAQPPRRPLPTGDFPPPGFEDEYEINRPLRNFPPSGRNPLNIGHDDLYPPGLGPHDPLRGTLGPGAGGIGGGGMHPTFDDPLFRGGGQGRPNDGRYVAFYRG
ncbi:MAG: hypothetical protein M1832_003671 [Thelocarpon impressellum]|nr:MAG: hypothetical protein M1832_003671 [Thelocarpon impressellum]